MNDTEKTGTGTTKRVADQTRTTKRDADQARAIRQWAQDNGHSVTSARGALDSEVDAGSDYDALSDWAENEMTLPIKSTTAKRGREAAAAGRALLDRVGGRPSLDPDAEPGTESPVRQVRLPQSLDARIDAIAAQQGRSRSAVLRDAAAEYADAHSANA